jgi:chemotaxis methyl-accepting protein methylase
MPGTPTAARTHRERDRHGFIRGELSTTGLPERFARHFVSPTPTGIEVVDVVKSVVAFRQFDLVEEEWLGTKQDLILCQNVMIYYGVEARNKIANRLAAALRPGGFLVLGAGESLGLELPELERVKRNDAWAYQRRQH